MPVEIDPFQVAVFQLSAGTSGALKIIPRFHNEYLYAMRTFIARHGFDEHIVAGCRSLVFFGGSRGG